MTEWTPEDDEILERMRADGAVLREMAERFNVSISSVYKRLKRLKNGVKILFEWTPDKDALIIKSRAEGVEWVDIAYDLGTTIGVAKWRGRFLDLPKREAKPVERKLTVQRAYRGPLKAGEAFHIISDKSWHA